MEKVNRTLALSYSRDKCTKTKEILVVHPLLSYGEGAPLESAPLLEARRNPLGLGEDSARALG